MNTTWRFLLALVIAVAISACKTTEPEPEPVTEPEPAPVVELLQQPHRMRMTIRMQGILTTVKACFPSASFTLILTGLKSNQSTVPSLLPTPPMYLLTAVHG